MANEIHVSKVGTYHPAEDTSAPWHSHAHCSICGWKGNEFTGMDRQAVALSSRLEADAHPCFHAPTEERAITYTSRETISPAWTIHDSRGTLDGGSACDGCGKCECEQVNGKTVCYLDDWTDGAEPEEGTECCGLSFSFVCLDGGENLCEECAAKAGITITECDCA